MNKVFEILSMFKNGLSIMPWRDAFHFAWHAVTRPDSVLRLRLLHSDFPIFLRSNTTDIDCFVKVFMHREYQIASSNPLKIIVDAGANIGLASRFFKILFPDALIFAIEPEPSNFALLKQNCSPIEGITLINAALWPCNETLKMASLDTGHWAFSVEPSTTVCTASPIQTITIPQLVQQSPTGRIDLLKLDVEGAEKPLFSNGAAQWLPKVDCIAIELHDRFIPGCASTFFSSLNDTPFAMTIVGENVFIDFHRAHTPKMKNEDD